jgi:hypothetical protein
MEFLELVGQKNSFLILADLIDIYGPKLGRKYVEEEYKKHHAS